MACSAVDSFLQMQLAISNELKDENIKGLKTLCEGIISKKKLENIKDGTDLFTCLKEKNELSPENVDKLRDLLIAVGRDDLANIVRSYQGNPSDHSTDPNMHPYIQNSMPSEVNSSEQYDTEDESQLDDAFDIICDNLGSDIWMRFMRKLGLADVTIQRAIHAHPQNLLEQQMQCFRKWRQQNGDAANVSALRTALRDTSQKLTEDILVKKLNLKLQ